MLKLGYKSGNLERAWGDVARELFKVSDFLPPRIRADDGGDDDGPKALTRRWLFRRGHAVRARDERPTESGSSQTRAQYERKSDSARNGPERTIKFIMVYFQS